MSDHPPDALSPATLLVAAGRPSREAGTGVNPPVEFSSTYAASLTATSYGRNSNPTWTALEEALGSLEGGDALVFASGMAAIAATLSLVPDGGPIVAPTAPYNLTSALLREYADQGHEVRIVDATDTTSVIKALSGAAMVWTESPTNPLLDVADLQSIFTEAKRQGVLSVCDNTLATPLLQKPIQLGADVVVHSVTKYLGGHSDVLLGATVASPASGLGDRLQAYRTLHGGIPGPMEAWLALRGLRTLSVRFERQCANAAEIASRAATHTAVERVRYPGFGAMVAIEVRGGADSADVVADACEVWLHATSLGGVESLLERRRRYPAESPTVPENLLRMSVGIEDVEDLWRDLRQALDKAT